MSTSARKRDQRLELRTTVEERAIINQAVELAGTGLTSYALTTILETARRDLADRTVFSLTREQAEEWDRINEMPARELPGLLRLMERPSPFNS